jgi:type I restriction enzyme, S subunit
LIPPSEWREMRFLDFVELHRGYDLPVQEREKGDIPIIGSNGVVGQHFEAKIKGPGVITGRSGSIGLAYYLENDYWPLNTSLYVSNFKKNYPGFVYFFFKHFDFKSCATGVSVPTLNRNSVHDRPVIIPPLPEQKKIAAVLFKIQQAIEMQERIIGTTRELKKTTMQHVFTCGLRGEKTKETELGRIAESWDIQPLGNLVDVRGGKRLPLGKQLISKKTEYPYIRVCDFKNNSVDVAGLLFVPPDVQPAIKRYIISHQDIYISIAGTTGLVGIVPVELDGAQLTENAARLILLSNAPLQKYLMYFLASDSGQKQIDALTMKTSQPKLALSRIKQINILIPQRSEQEQIARMFESIDKKIVLHTAKRSALQDLFKTMLNKLMTGEIRVKDLDINTSEINCVGRNDM